MLTKPILTADHAEAIGKTCLKFAKGKNWEVCVAVCDDGGNLLWLQRDYTVPPISSTIAGHKARTSVLGRRPSKAYETVINEGRLAFLSVPDLKGLMEGGLPIFVHEYCIGGVGVSNLKASDDALVAEQGIRNFIGSIENKNE